MDSNLLGLGILLSLIVVLWSFRLERKFQRVLDTLQRPKPRMPNLTYPEMIELLGTEDHFVAKRDIWPEGTCMKYQEGLLIKYSQGTFGFEEYFWCAEDVKAKDWTVLVPFRP